MLHFGEKKISGVENKKKPRFFSKKVHTYEYNEPTAFTLGLQKIINFTMKKFIDPLAENSLIKDKKGRDALNPRFLAPLKWIYTTAVIGGGIVRRLPKSLLYSMLHTIKKLGFDFSKFLMISLPHEKFEKSTSVIFIPDSKDIELKTSDGKMVLPHHLVIEMLERVCAYDPEHSIAQIHFCICRMSQDCQNYPKGIGCMIVGPGAPDVVERGIGKILTLKQAIKQIQKLIIPNKLSSFISAFPNDLHYIWGVKTHHSKYTFELCYCCPCCCVLKRQI